MQQGLAYGYPHSHQEHSRQELRLSPIRRTLVSHSRKQQGKQVNQMDKFTSRRRIREKKVMNYKKIGAELQFCL